MMILKKYYRYLLLLTLSFAFLQCKKSKSDPSTPPEQAIQYPISTTLIYPNTERGFVKTLIVFSEGEPLDLADLKLLRGQNISMVIRVFYLDKYKTQAINSTELTLIQSDINKVREAGLKIILRFGYTDDVAGTDASYDIVAQHLDQLKPIFEANKDVIAFLQAGFIGAFGEWHSSSNGLATIENERKVLTKILSVLPQEIMVQVRTPGVKQGIFSTTLPVAVDIAYTADGRARVGHHNDCFLSGGTEYGTYMNILAEKQYISNEAQFVPVGGETCPPMGGYSPNCMEGQKEMALLKWTYLNIDYYPPTIAAWKSSGCFDEFQKYLGHRIGFVTATLPNEVNVNGSLRLKITLANKGYAPLYNKKNTALVLKNKTSGQFYTIPMALDIRTIKPSLNFDLDENLSVSAIPAGDYDMFIRIADQAASLKDRIEYAVRLSNTEGWVEENGGMNSLKHTITIK